MTGTPSDHLANERTFLAYIRTALAFVGFGFVISRFAIFLRQYALIAHQALPRGTNASVTFGVVMVLIGVGMAIFGSARYVRERAALMRNESRALSSAASVIIVVVVALFGILISADLVAVAHSL